MTWKEFKDYVEQEMREIKKVRDDITMDLRDVEIDYIDITSQGLFNDRNKPEVGINNLGLIIF